MSVINSVLLLLAVNDAEDDHHATILLRKLGLWFTLPALYFYLGVLIGTIGWFIWIPAVSPLAPAIVIVVTGFAVGIGINSGYYQFIVLSVYEARLKCGMNIFTAPSVIARLSTCGRKPLKVVHKLAQSNTDETQDALSVLKNALEFVDQANLLSKAIDEHWSHTDALRRMEERHAVGLGLQPGLAVRVLERLRQELKIEHPMTHAQGGFKVH